MLFNGEHVGDGSGPEVDIAVDPVDGTTLTAKSLPDAVSVLGVSPRGTMFDPGPAVYMQKLVVPGAVAGQVDLDAPIVDTLRTIARHADRKVEDLTVAVLDRPRHQALVDELRTAGARIRFLLDGDVAGAIMAVTPGSGVDLLVGTGGTPEGVLAACALRCLGGEMLGRLIARDDAERKAALDGGLRPEPDSDDLGSRLGRQRLLRRDRCHRWGPSQGCPVRVPSGGHPLAVHAVPLGNDSPHRGPARPSPLAVDQLLSPMASSAGRVKLSQALDPLVLAVDIGSTASQGDVFDAAGRPVEGGRQKMPHHSPPVRRHLRDRPGPDRRGG